MTTLLPISFAATAAAAAFDFITIDAIAIDHPIEKSIKTQQSMHKLTLNHTYRHCIILNALFQSVGHFRIESLIR